MQKIKYYIGLAWTWIVTSSANPNMYSMTLKYALLGFVPYVIQALSLACGVHVPHACYTIDENVLSAIIDAVATVLFWALSIVSAVGTIWGFARKLFRTATGDNVAVAVFQAGHSDLG